MKSAREKPRSNKKSGYRGDVPGCYFGQTWEKRIHMIACGMHQQAMAGIDGREDCGCHSVVMSAGYEDDEDRGEEIIYTGCGGQNATTKAQEKDQEFKGKNASLVVSSHNKYPVRVIRGHTCPSPHAPETGYRYDGLYTVESFWKEKLRGFEMCRFRLQRIPGQPPLPTPRTEFKTKKRHASSTKTPAVLRGDANYLCESMESAVQKAALGFCIVCEREVEGGCGVEHIEMHVKELWDTFEAEEKVKVAQRGAINLDRINSVVDVLTAETPIIFPTSTVFSWP
jgi:hypothetical protein